MGLPNEIHPFLIAGNDANQYKITNSLRFRASATAYLRRTFSSGNRQTWTWSAWVKRGTLGSSGVLFESFGPGGFGIDGVISFTSANVIDFIFDYNAGSRWELTTTQVFRDPSAWYHIVIVADTTNATPGDRLRIYVNGSRVTVFSTANYPSLSANGTLNQAYAHGIGADTTPSTYFDGYLAEVNFIDGQALTPSSFGQSNALTGVWEPKQYTGTYGTNGFYLPFNDSTSTTTLGYDRQLGMTDSSKNNWTLNNIGASSSANTVAKFTTVGTYTWTVPLGITSVRYLVVGGGGGGANDWGMAGAGAGGVVYGSMNVIPGNNYTIIVGDGGAPVSNGNNSSFHTIVALGGASGGYGTAGGSGSGGAYTDANPNSIYAGISIQPSYANAVSYGNSGGNYAGSGYGGGGGGGAGGAGGVASGSYVVGGNGGAGVSFNLYGTSVTYAGGGGGGAYYTGGSGGSGIGGNGGRGGGGGNVAGGAGANNTGSGGGSGYGTGGRGGSGIVLVVYNEGPTYDVMPDSPTNYNDGGNGRGNYAVLNPIDTVGTAGSIIDGNLKLTGGSSAWYQTRCGFGLTSGKWYWEVTIISTNVSTNGICIGISSSGTQTAGFGTANQWVYNNNSSGRKSLNGTSSAYGTAFVTNDVVGVAFDADAGTLVFYVNNVSQGTAASSGLPNPAFPMVNAYGSDNIAINFGQRPFSYTPPTGFKALNTYNLPNPSLPLV